MKKKFCTFFVSFFVCLFLEDPIFGRIYNLCEKDTRLLGKNKTFVIPEDNIFPLEYFASKFQVGISNLLEINPKVDVYLPGPKTKIIIPNQLILPNTVHNGIIINSAEMRLFFYPKNGRQVIVFPIGIGEIGKETPFNWITSVKRKKFRPTWIPTSSARSEYSSHGKNLPKVFPPGPDNPMGLYALYIGKLYAIHGTNSKFGIGLRSSRGCVRLRNQDIRYLFHHVSTGTRVQFINEPIKIIREKNGDWYIEVHSPITTSKEQYSSKRIVPIFFQRKVRNLLSNPKIDQLKLYFALKEKNGIPINITKY